MRREASIPLFLWVATAVLAHLLWGGGVDRGAKLIEERLDIGRFASGVRTHVRSSIAPPLEIAIDDESTPEEEAKPEDEPEDDAEDPNAKDEDPEEASEDARALHPGERCFRPRRFTRGKIPDRPLRT